MLHVAVRLLVHLLLKGCFLFAAAILFLGVLVRPVSTFATFGLASADPFLECLLDSGLAGIRIATLLPASVKILAKIRVVILVPFILARQPVWIILVNRIVLSIGIKIRTTVESNRIFTQCPTSLRMLRFQCIYLA